MKTLFSIFVFFILSTFLSATIINVPEDQPTIQAGINVAVDSDTVLVQPGSYVENINYNGKLITVASLFLTTQDTTYISQTIIDGDSIDNAVKFESEEDSTSVLCGFTIQNGLASYGGGIYCYESSPSLKNVTITGNTTEYAGGGIYCYESSPSLKNVTITGNTTEYYGGGFYCYESSPSLKNVLITGNTTEYYGGGIHCDESSPSLENVTIIGNSAGVHGGGFYYWDSSPSFSVDNRCSIYSNTIGNTRGFGADMFAVACDTIHIIVDTFTVMTPTDYYASPINNFTFDILHSVVDSLINADVYVSVDGDNSNSGTSPDFPFKTINHALSRIYFDGLNINTIHLAPGIYSNSTNGEIFPIYWSNYINLAGNSEDETILDADSTSGVMDFNVVTDAIISNITITNGNSADQHGGIRCYNSSPILQNVTISSNTESGISCYGSSPSLINVTISDNSGHGIYCYNSSPILQNVTISGNSTDDNGGGIYCNYNSSPSLVNVTISGNSADDNGGGIYCWNSSPSLENVTISDNTGHGIFCYYSSPNLQNVTISGNSASVGGGICCYYSSPILQNVTISGNTASYLVGGIFCSDNSSPSLANCIMWNDSPQEIYFYENSDPNSITISYSDIQGGEAGIVTNNNGTVNWLEGNINEDPLFVGTGVYPYSLLEDSPCIDAGNPDPIYFDPEDVTNPGYALYPAMGTIINDMGAYGGPNTIGWPAVELDDNIIVQTPEAFLHQNYPNPFNPSTTISFSSTELTENTEIIIYNIKGQKVKKLFSFPNRSLGTRSVVWNGKNENNKPVGSGIYFYKLKASGYSIIKKMLLLK